MPFNIADLKLGLTQFLASNAESLQKFTHVMQTFGKNLRTSSPLTTKSGWFLTWATAFSPHEIDENIIDAHMTILLEQDWDGLKTALIDSHPTRKDILNEAFLLHEEGRYIASIPLFFSQADGICQDMLQGVVLQINKFLNVERFNHFLAASQITKTGFEPATFSANTLSRFEEIFKDLNKLF